MTLTLTGLELTDAAEDVSALGLVLAAFTATTTTEMVWRATDGHFSCFNSATSAWWWGRTPLLVHGRWNAQHIYKLRVFPLVASIAELRTIPSFMLALFAISFFRCYFYTEDPRSAKLRSLPTRRLRGRPERPATITHGPCHCTAADRHQRSLSRDSGTAEHSLSAIPAGDFNARIYNQPRPTSGYT